MRLYFKLIYYGFIYLIQGNNFKFCGPLFVEAQGSGAGISDATTHPEKTTNPTEITVSVDIKKNIKTGFTREIIGSEITYRTQPEYSFNVVKDAGTEIWNTNDKNEYSKKVVADFGSKTVTVYIGTDDNSKKVFKKGYDNKWVEEGYQTQSSFTSTSGESSETCCSLSSIWRWIIKWLFCGCCGCCGCNVTCGYCGVCGACGLCGRSGSKTGIDIDIKSVSGSFRIFDYSRDGNYVTYTAKGSNAFKSVNDDTIKVWDTSDPDEYSSKVEVDNLSSDSKAVTVFPGGDETKIFIKSGIGDPWTQFDLSKVHAKSVNIGYPYVSYFSKIESQAKTRTFIAKKGFAFKGAIDFFNEKKVKIWKTDNESEYANKIVNEGGKKITIHIGEGNSAYTKVFNKKGFCKWEEDTDSSKKGTDTGTKTGVELTLEATSSTDALDYEEVDEYVIYTAKDNNAFKLVKDDCIEVWKAKDETEYATQVVLNGKGQNEKIVTLYLLNGTTKVFRTDDKIKTWIECTQYIKLFKADPNDANKTVELGTGDYKYEFDGEHVYEFNSGVKCTLLNIKGKDVWKYDSSKHNGKYPERMGIMKETILIHFDDRYEVYVRDGDNYKICEFVKEKSVELDINKDAGTDQFDYNKFGNTAKFTGKGGHGFNIVKEDDKEIWKTDHVSEYAIKVLLSGEDQKFKIVTIHKLDNHKVLCVREDKNQPWQSFDLSKINPVPVNISFTSDTFKFTNKLVGQTRSFEAKTGFIFNQVRCYINKNWVDIWKTDNEKECSKKVVVEGENKVTIYIGEGDNASTKVFNKGTDNKWTEDTQASTQKSTTDGSGGGTTQTSPTSGGTTGTTPASGGGTQSTPSTQ